MNKHIPISKRCIHSLLVLGVLVLSTVRIAPADELPAELVQRLPVNSSALPLDRALAESIA